MRIIILDGYTINPGDNPLEPCGGAGGMHHLWPYTG